MRRLKLIRHYLQTALPLSLLQSKIGEYLGIFLLGRQLLVAGGAIVGNCLPRWCAVRRGSGNTQENRCAPDCWGCTSLPPVFLIAASRLRYFFSERMYAIRSFT
jgi:hypothetical protein